MIGHRAAAAAALALAAACASADPPPGGERDLAAPRVAESWPEPGAVITAFDRPAVFRFDERISERVPERMVLVSPATGELRVERGSREVRVIPAGGWRPGLVYRVVLLPGIQDLFGNERRRQAELVFSTGPELFETALAGVVTDRLTGMPEPAAVVEAIHAPDSVRHIAVADSSGFYALRYLPPGEYLVRGFRDVSRNLRLDPREERAQATVRLAEADTVVLDLPLIAVDTTPARMVAADMTDSISVRLTFDDHLDPARDPDAEARLWLLPDSSRVPVAAVLHPHQLDAREAAEAATPPRGEPPPEADAGPPAQGAPGADPLPSRELFLALESALAPGRTYRVTIERVTNIAGVPGGGGSVTFVAPEPPPPEPEPEPDEDADGEPEPDPEPDRDPETRDPAGGRP